MKHSDKVEKVGVYGLLALALTGLVLGFGGVLAGLGMFIIGIITLKVTTMAGGAFTAAVAAGVFGGAYMWLTP